MMDNRLFSHFDEEENLQAFINTKDKREFVHKLLTLRRIRCNINKVISDAEMSGVEAAAMERLI